MRTSEDRAEQAARKTHSRIRGDFFRVESRTSNSGCSRCISFASDSAGPAISSNTSFAARLPISSIGCRIVVNPGVFKLA